MMNNCFGVISVIAGGMYIGILKARYEKNKTLMLRDLCSLLELMKNEICAEKTSLTKLFSLERLNDFSSIYAFIELLRKNAALLGEKRFFDIWSECIYESLKDLPDKSKCALYTLGNSLGKYDCEIQRSAIDRCSNQIQYDYELLEKSLKNNEKMYIGLGFGAGVMLALMLI